MIKLLKPVLKKENNSYSFGLDLLRLFAMFFVILVHSTTFYGFVSEGVSSFPLFLAGIGRYLSFSCVPLFIMLTGFLSCNKTPTVDYYLKIIRILCEFVLCGIVVFLFNKLYYKSPITIIELIKGLINFSYPPYSWYINMYVGLFLIAPFLNYVINGLNQKTAIAFTVVLVLIFSNPQVTTYWTSAYPLMYYFIGAIIKKYQIKVKKIYLIIAILLCCIIQTILLSHPIPKYAVENHNNLGCVIITTSLFLTFYNTKANLNKKCNYYTCSTLRIIANASLSAYLVSSIFESFTATYFINNQLLIFSQRLPYLLWITPLKFVLSVICGIIINFVSKIISDVIFIIIDKIKAKIAKSKNKKELTV